MGKDWLEDVAATARPLFKRIGKRGGAAFGRKIGASEQQVNNWKRRGVPQSKIGKIAAELGLSYEQYMREVGAPTTAVKEPGSQYSLDRVSLMNDFEALPVWLQEHIARKTAELRAYSESLPAFVRDGMRAPPKDPVAYEAWEKNIVADMAARQAKSRPPPSGPEDKAASTEKRFPIGETPTGLRGNKRERKAKR